MARMHANSFNTGKRKEGKTQKRKRFSTADERGLTLIFSLSASAGERAGVRCRVIFHPRILRMDANFFSKSLNTAAQRRGETRPFRPRMNTDGHGWTLIFLPLRLGRGEGRGEVSHNFSSANSANGREFLFKITEHRDAKARRNKAFSTTDEH